MCNARMYRLLLTNRSFSNSPGPSTPGPSDVGGDSGININGSGSQVNGKSTGGKKKTIPGTTARRCANCAASGHIKTNRK